MGLQLRGDRWHYRRMVPKALREVLGKREVKQSLGAIPKAEAELLAAELDAATDLEFARARSQAALQNALRATIDPGGLAPQALGEKSQPAQGPASVSPSINACREAFFTDRQHSMAPARQRVANYHLDRLVGILGDTPLGEVDKARAREVRAALLEDGLSVSYINQLLFTAGALWGWAEDEAGLVVGNPWRRLTLPRKTRTRDERLPFSPGDVKAILELECDGARYWVPRLMLTLGLRPDEAAQLRGEDVVEEDGHLCVWVRDDHPEQRLKTRGSKRLLPVPRDSEVSHLLSAYAGTSQWLFAGLPVRTDMSRSRPISRWFSSQLRRHLGLTDRRQVLYSLRHTLAARLRATGAEDSLIDDILGHETPGESARYHGTATIASKLEALEKAAADIEMCRNPL